MSKRLFYILLTIIPIQTLAEDTDTLNIQSFYHLDEIVIESFKQEKILKALPTAVTKMTGTTLRNQHLLSTKEISSLIPNLYMPDYGSRYTSPVFIRGIGAKSDSPSVGLYIDGIPYFEKSTFDFDLTDIERIEVLRGPQGTLYGRNAMGGLIHVYTQSPLKIQRTNVQLQAGNRNQYQAAVSHSDKLTDNLAYALSANYRYHGGFFTNTFRDEKADEAHSGNVRFRLEWQMSSDWKLALTSLYDRSIQGANAYAPFDTESRTTGGIAFDAPSYYQRTLTSNGLSVNYEGERFQLYGQQSFQYTKDRLRQDQDFSLDPKISSFIGMHQCMTSSEWNFKAQLGEHYHGLMGAFGFYQHAHKQVNTDYPSRSTFKTDRLPTYGIAVYHQSTIKHLGLEELSLTLGLRYDYENADRNAVSTTARPDAQAADAQSAMAGRPMQTTQGSDAPLQTETNRSFSQWVPKASLQYTFPSTGQIYATVAKGYKTGGFNTSYNTEEERDYGPESTWNYEIGAKHPFLDRILNAEIAFYWIDWRNQQIQQRVDAGGFMIRNAGKSASRGMELSLLCNPVNGLMVDLNYGYTYATFKRYQQSEKVDYSGKALPMVPRHTLGASINYARSISGRMIDRFQVGMSCTGNGKIYWREDNQEVQPFYAVLNASASVSKGMITWSFWAKNLTQTHYHAYLFKASSGTYVQPGKPLTIGTKLTIEI